MASSPLVPRAMTRVELLAVLSCSLLVVGVVLPVMASVRDGSGVAVSRSNVIVLGAAHAIYAADWDGRQVQNAYDGLSTLGDTAIDAFAAYDIVFGEWHPAHVLGWGELPGGGVTLFRYFNSPGQGANHVFSQPIAFQEPKNLAGYGGFRLINARPLHAYVSGRFYDPSFYAPNDERAFELAEPFFDSEFEYVSGAGSALGDVPYWSSYITSPAALYDPAIMRAPSAGGWQDPWVVDTAFEVPGLFTAKYPSLKTQMLEHHWNQNTPEDVCNPDFEAPTFAGCEPYYFNHAADSEPVALFYDLSARLLPNAEARAADASVMKATGEGLWSRDTPFGEAGYFGDIAFDEGYFQSHHVLTTDGIRGRDTIAGEASSSHLLPSGSK